MTEPLECVPQQSVLELDANAVALAVVASEAVSHPHSLCALRAASRKQVVEDGQTSLPTPGEVLLAYAGVHPGLSLTNTSCAALRALLRPVATDVNPDWGLKPHQEEGYRWLMARASCRLGAILADDMGLGKTRQAVMWLLTIRAQLSCTAGLEDASGDALDSPVSRMLPPTQLLRCGAHGCGRQGCEPLAWERALVVAPGMLVKGDDSVWVTELQQVAALMNCPLRIWSWHGAKAQRLRSEARTSVWAGSIIELFDVVVVSYESFLANQDEFCREPWTCVILDEAQKIKNCSAKTAEAVKRLSEVKFRLALTGTPIENRVEDLHSILQFVQPECAGSLPDFWRRFPQTADGRIALRKLLQCLVLRRRAGDTVKMVTREDIEVPLQLVEGQSALYERLREDPGFSSLRKYRMLEVLCSHPWCLAAQAHGPASTSLEGHGSAVVPAARMEGMKGFLSHMPEQYLKPAADQEIKDSAKMQELFNILRGLLSRGEKVIVFFCRQVTCRLLEALVEREFHFKPGAIFGETAAADRSELLQRFRLVSPQAGRMPTPVLLLSIWVGGVGLSLPEARTVIHFERVWNPAVEKQATSRIHRITSTMPVKSYLFFSMGTVEEQKLKVLTQKATLSTEMLDALDTEGAEDMNVDMTLLEEDLALQAMSTWDDAEANLSGSEDVSSDEEEGDAGEAGSIAMNQGRYPLAGELRPTQLMQPLVGKYGDPCNSELWDWYVNKGRREMHAKAPLRTTGHLQISKEPSRSANDGEPATKPAATQRPVVAPRGAGRIASRATRVYDIKARADTEMTIELSDGVTCRLFVPEALRHYFSQDSNGSWKLCHEVLQNSGASIPIFTPSTGRSALDGEVGLLDLTDAMVDMKTGKRVDYLQIVAVKPSEVSNYCSSGPFFVVLELPGTVTLDHQQYGPETPEELGVGCSRHWIMRVADVLGADFIFMLDDSVRSWKGLTLAGDPINLFGKEPDKKAHFTNTSLHTLLAHFAGRHGPEGDEDIWLREERHKLAMLGFARFRPNLTRCRRAFKRSHVYSAFILNVKRILHEQKINFRQDLFIWEDLMMNVQAQEVCKCYRFAMVKKMFNTGGCSELIARSSDPFKPCVGIVKASASVIAAEVLGAKPCSGSSSSTGTTTTTLAILEDIEDNEHSFLPENAVCKGDTDILCDFYYRAFVQRFRDKEIAMMDPAAPNGPHRRPGPRVNEEIPPGLRSWDDTQSTVRVLAPDRWGAGWIAVGPEGRGDKWFNVKKWGSWRLAFVLARLQSEVWRIKREPKKQLALCAPQTKVENEESAIVLLDTEQAQPQTRKRGRPRKDEPIALAPVKVERLDAPANRGQQQLVGKRGRSKQEEDTSTATELGQPKVQRLAKTEVASHWLQGRADFGSRDVEDID